MLYYVEPKRKGDGIPSIEFLHCLSHGHRYVPTRGNSRGGPAIYESYNYRQLILQPSLRFMNL